MRRLALMLMLLGLAGPHALCQAPPTPPDGVTVTLLWDANAPEQEVAAYYVHQAATITGPWEIIGSAKGTNYTVTLTNRGRWFWYVTASNFWGMSEPSNIVNTPASSTMPTNLYLTR